MLLPAVLRAVLLAAIPELLRAAMIDWIRVWRVVEQNKSVNPLACEQAAQQGVSMSLCVATCDSLSLWPTPNCFYEDWAQNWRGAARK